MPSQNTDGNYYVAVAFQGNSTTAVTAEDSNKQNAVLQYDHTSPTTCLQVIDHASPNYVLYQNCQGAVTSCQCTSTTCSCNPTTPATLPNFVDPIDVTVIGQDTISPFGSGIDGSGNGLSVTLTPPTGVTAPTLLPSHFNPLTPPYNALYYPYQPITTAGNALTYSFTVTAKDAAGNASNSSPYTYTIQTSIPGTPPTISVVYTPDATPAPYNSQPVNQIPGSGLLKNIGFSAAPELTASDLAASYDYLYPDSSTSNPSADVVKSNGHQLQAINTQSPTYYYIHAPSAQQGEGKFRLALWINGNLFSPVKDSNGNPIIIYYDNTAPTACIRVLDHASAGSWTLYQNCPNNSALNVTCPYAPSPSTTGCTSAASPAAFPSSFKDPIDVIVFGVDTIVYDGSGNAISGSGMDDTDNSGGSNSATTPRLGLTVTSSISDGSTAPQIASNYIQGGAPYSALYYQYPTIIKPGSLQYTFTTAAIKDVAGNLTQNFSLPTIITNIPNPQPTVTMTAKNLDTGADTGWSCAYQGATQPTCTTAQWSYPVFFDMKNTPAVTGETVSYPTPAVNSTVVGSAPSTTLSNPSGYEFELGADAITQPMDVNPSTTLSYVVPAISAQEGAGTTTINSFSVTLDMSQFFPKNFSSDPTKATPSSIYYDWVAPIFAGTNFKLTQLGIYWDANGPGPAGTLIQLETTNSTGHDLIDFSKISAANWQAGKTLTVNSYMMATYSDGTHTMRFRTASPGDTSSTKTANPPIITFTVTPYDGSTVVPCTTSTCGTNLAAPGKLAITVTGGTLSGAISGAQTISANTYELATSQAMNGTYAGTITASDPVNGSVTTSANYTASMANLFPGIASLYPGSDKNHLFVSWPAATSYASFPLQGYVIKYQGGQTAQTTATNMQFPLTNLSGWSTHDAGQPFPVSLTIESQYTGQAPAQPYSYDTVAPTYSIPGGSAPTLTFTARSLADGLTSQGTCGVPAIAGCQANITGPVILSVAAAAGAGDSGVSLQSSVSGASTPVGHGSNPTTYWLVVSNNPNPNYSATATATGNNTVVTTPAAPFPYTLDFTGLYATLFAGSATGTSPNVTFTWTKPIFTGGQHFTLSKYRIIWASNDNGAVQSNPVLVDNIAATALSQAIDFSANPYTKDVWKNLPAGQPLNTRTYIETVWHSDTTGQDYVYDYDPSISVPIGGSAPPVITVTATSLATGGLPADCVSAADCACTTAGSCAVTLFHEPITLNVAAAAPSGTVTLSPLSVTGMQGGTVTGATGAGQNAPTNNATFTANLPQNTASSTFTIVSGGASPTTPLDYTITAKATANGASSNFDTAAGPPDTNYQLSLGGLFATALNGVEQANQSAKVDYTWKNPTFAGGTNFQLVGIVLRWKGTIAGNSVTNPPLTPTAKITDFTHGDKVTATIDFSAAPTTGLWTAAQNASSALATDVIIETIWQDVGAGVYYYYDQPTDFPLDVGGITAGAAPTITVTATSLADGTVKSVCPQTSGGAANCQHNLFEPVLLNIMATPGANDTGVASLTPSVSIGGNAILPVDATNANYDYELAASNNPNPQYSVSATATGLNQVVATLPAATYSTLLTTLYATQFKGTATSMSAITYSWTKPAFPGGYLPDSGFKLNQLQLRWDSSTDSSIPNYPTLGSVITDFTQTSASIDFSTNQNTATAFSGRKPVGSPFLAAVLLEADYVDANNTTFVYYSQLAPVSTLPDQAPVVTFNVQGIVTGSTCAFTVPTPAGGQNCTTTDFDEPAVLTLSAHDPDAGDSVAPFTTSLSFDNGTGSPATITGGPTPPPVPIGTRSWNYSLVYPNGDYTASVQATDSYSNSQSPNRSYTLDFSQYSPTNAGGTPINLSSVQFNWVPATFQDTVDTSVPPKFGLKFQDLRLRWSGAVGTTTDPILVSGINRHATQVSYDFSQGPVASVFAALNPKGTTFHVTAYLEAYYLDYKNTPYYMRTYIPALDTTQNVVINPGQAVAVTTGSITAQWTLTQSQMLQISNFRAVATDSKNNYAGTKPTLDATTLSPAGQSAITLTVDLLNSNTTYAVALQGSYDGGTTWINYVGGTFSATTLVAKPAVPTAGFTGSNGQLNMIFGFNADGNSVDTPYAIQVTPPNGQPVYLLGDGTKTGSVSQALFTTQADWLSGKNHLDNVSLNASYAVAVAAQQLNAKTSPAPTVVSDPLIIQTPFAAPSGPNAPLPATNLTATHTSLTRAAWAWTLPATVPAGYTIQLLDASNDQVLATVYPPDPSNVLDSTGTFVETVNAPPGTVLTRYLKCTVNTDYSFSNSATATLASQGTAFTVTQAPAGFQPDGPGTAVFGVDYNSPLTIGFSNDVDPGNIASGLVLETGGVGNVWATVPNVTFKTGALGTNSLTITPSVSAGSALLNGNQAYRLTLPSSMVDVDGNHLTATRIVFYTAMDPTKDNTLQVMGSDGLLTSFFVPANSLTASALSSLQAHAAGASSTGSFFTVVRPDFGPSTHAASFSGVPISIIQGAAGLIPIGPVRELLIYNGPGNLMQSFNAGNLPTVTMQFSAVSGLSSRNALTLTLYYINMATMRPEAVPGATVDLAAHIITAKVLKPGVYFIAYPVPTSLSEAIAYPVPFKPSAGHTTIKFDNLGDGSTIKVYTIMGELVAQLQNTSGQSKVEWPVTNMHGDPVASGVYIYQIKNSFDEKRGKLIITR